MDELDKGLLNSVTNEQAGPIIERIMKILASWDVAMPAVPPLVFDFGLGEFDTIGETEFWIANETTHGYCGKYLFLFEGQRCPNHMHKIKHETFFIVKGNVRMRYGENEILMKPGDVLPVSQLTYHTFIAESNALILEVSMPGIIADNYFTDQRLGYRFE